MRTALFAVLAGAALAGSASVAPVATVFELRGRWVAEGQPPRVLARGTALESAARIRPPAKPATGDFLVVVYATAEAVRFECPRDCTTSLQLKAYDTLDQRTVWRERWAAIERLFWGNPSRYIAAITRGDRPDDTVLARQAEGVDVRPLLERAGAGTYSLSFRPVGRAEEPPTIHAVTRAAGAPDTPVFLPHPPGLFALEIRRRLGGRDAQTVGAPWVLIVDASAHAAVRAAFDDVRARIDAWPDDVSVQTRRAVLRATLESLARESGSPHE